jgi:hypothetical protein
MSPKDEEDLQDALKLFKFCILGVVLGPVLVLVLFLLFTIYHVLEKVI